jgi:hypothetical protein
MREKTAKFLLRVAAIVLFCSFAAASGAFASTHDEAGVSTEGAPLEMTTDESVDNVEQSTCDLVSESTDNADPLVSNPAEFQTCVNACKAGGAAMLRYCAVFLLPNIRALCIIASGGGFVVCSGFCAARFKD